MARAAARTGGPTASRRSPVAAGARDWLGQLSVVTFNRTPGG